MTDTSIVYVVDDDPAMRKSLKFLIESVGRTAIALPSTEAFLEQYKPEQPGVLILDVRMPGMSGLELQRRLKERDIHIPIIIITGHGEVSTAVAAMKTGAFDFFEKPFNDQALLDRVSAAINHDLKLRKEREERGRVSTRMATLTPRERDVMQLVVSGRANKQVAMVLGLSEKTVEVHRANVMRKIGAESLAELVRLVLSVEPAIADASEQDSAKGK